MFSPIFEHTPGRALGRALSIAFFTAFAVGCSGGADQEDADSEPHAVAKFCNDLSKGGDDVVLSLEVGFPVAARFSASTGTCHPAAPAPCASIPLGIDVPVTLRDGAQVLWQGTMNDVQADAEWLLVAGLDDVSGEPSVEGGPLKPEYRCSELE